MDETTIGDERDSIGRLHAAVLKTGGGIPRPDKAVRRLRFLGTLIPAASCTGTQAAADPREMWRIYPRFPRDRGQRDGRM